MGFNYGMHVPVVSVLGTLINYDDDDDDDDDNNNDNAKKNKQTIGCMSKTIALHHAS